MNKTRQDVCPSCKSFMKWGPKNIAVAGVVTINVTTWHCKCGEALLKGDALKAWDTAYKKVRNLA